MNKEIQPPDEDYKIRCPRLGHQISFSYCRSENKGLPCFKTIDCWFAYFPVNEFLQKELASEEWEAIFNRPNKPKILSLVELIEAAKKMGGEGKS